MEQGTPWQRLYRCIAAEASVRPPETQSAKAETGYTSIDAQGQYHVEDPRPPRLEPDGLTAEGGPADVSAPLHPSDGSGGGLRGLRGTVWGSGKGVQTLPAEGRDSLSGGALDCSGPSLPSGMRGPMQQFRATGGLSGHTRQE